MELVTAAWNEARKRLELVRAWTATSCIRSRMCTRAAIVKAVASTDPRVPLTYPTLGNVGPGVDPDHARRRRRRRCAGATGCCCMGVGSRLNTVDARDRLVSRPRPRRRLARRPGPARARSGAGRAWSSRRRADGVPHWHLLDNGPAARCGAGRHAAVRARQPDLVVPVARLVARAVPARGRRPVAGDRRRPARDGLLRAHRRGAPSRRPGRRPRRAHRRARARGPGRHRRARLGRPDLASAGRVDHPEPLAGVVLTNTAVHQPADDAVPAAAPARARARRAADGHVADAGVPRDHARARAPAARRRRPGGFPRAVPHCRAAARHRASSSRDIPARRRRTRARPSSTASPTGVARCSTCPRCCSGARGIPCSGALPRDLRERLPHADVHRFEGAGHLVAEDADVASAVLAWLGAGAAGRREAEPTAVAAEYDPLWSALDAPAGTTPHRARRDGPDRRTALRRVSWRLARDAGRQLAAGLVDDRRAAGATGSPCSSRPAPTSRPPLYACLRIGAVVVVADAGLGLRGIDAGRQRRTARLSSSACRAALARRPGAAAGPARASRPAGSSDAAARALGVDLPLADSPRRARAAAPSRRPRRPTTIRRRALHLRIDRPGEGRRATRTASSAACATRSRGDVRARPGDRPRRRLRPVRPARPGARRAAR